MTRLQAIITAAILILAVLYLEHQHSSVDIAQAEQESVMELYQNARQDSIIQANRLLIK
ncbi:hypothetical protein PG299_02740 [Riemerella anatipestifer]|nr:hypothetical protein [Riemerella anatipestifer]MDY3443446.1 hypothetical protein [Riemerella anatipestifer]